MFAENFFDSTEIEAKDETQVALFGEQSEAKDEAKHPFIVAKSELHHFTLHFI